MFSSFTGSFSYGRRQTSRLPAPVVLSLDADGYIGTGNWLDSSGNSNNAVLQGTPSFVSTSPKYFDLVPGEGDFFTITDSSSLDSMTEISIEMWVNIDTISSSGPNMLLSKRVTTSDGYVGFFTTTGWTFRAGTGTGTGLTYGTAPTTGVWQHIVAVMGSTGSNFYINGSEVQNSAYTANSVSINTSAALDLFEVNPRPQTGPVRMDGKVGLVRIYNGSLSSVDVAARWSTTKTRFGL